jgi:hypothetical protein
VEQPTEEVHQRVRAQGSILQNSASAKIAIFPSNYALILIIYKKEHIPIYVLI